MKKLNITFCSYPDFASNAKPLYEYMKNRYKDSMNYTWIVYNEETVTLLKEKGIDAILIGTDEFWKYVPKTDVFFTTHGNLDGDKTDKSIYVELWHGIGPKPVGYLCNNPSKEDIKGYNHMRKIFDYMIVPNDFWKVIYSCIFHVEASRILSLGMPIFDYFKNSNGKKNLSKVLDIDVSKYKKIIAYMPTFKKGFNHNDIKDLNNNNIFNFPKYDEKKLDKFLKDNNYLLCVKRHPGEEMQFEDYNSDNIINIKESALTNNNLSVNEIINAFDLLITDYSSLGTEFIFLEKPVLYTIDDIDEYNDERGIVFSNFDFWAIGPQCKNIESLILETGKLLKNKKYYAEERKNAKELYFGNLQDGGCKQICDFLFDGNKISSRVKHYKDIEDTLNEKIEYKDLVIKEQREQIDNIVNSKGWKFLEKLRNIKRKIWK